MNKRLAYAMEYIEGLEKECTQRDQLYHEERRKVEERNGQLEYQMRVVKDLQDKLTLKQSDNDTILAKLKEWEDRQLFIDAHPEKKKPPEPKKLKVVDKTILPTV